MALNARIQQKHDIEFNWNKASGFIPNAGEIIIYDPDAHLEGEGKGTRTVAQIKIGNGFDNVIDLPFSEQVDWNQEDEKGSGYIKNKPPISGDTDETTIKSTDISLLARYSDTEGAAIALHGEFGKDSIAIHTGDDNYGHSNIELDNHHGITLSNDTYVGGQNSTLEVGDTGIKFNTHEGNADPNYGVFVTANGSNIANNLLLKSVGENGQALISEDTLHSGDVQVNIEADSVTNCKASASLSADQGISLSHNDSDNKASITLSANGEQDRATLSASNQYGDAYISSRVSGGGGNHVELYADEARTFSKIDLSNSNIELVSSNGQEDYEDKTTVRIGEGDLSLYSDNLTENQVSGDIGIRRKSLEFGNSYASLEYSDPFTSDGTSSILSLRPNKAVLSADNGYGESAVEMNVSSGGGSSVKIRADEDACGAVHHGEIEVSTNRVRLTNNSSYDEKSEIRLSNGDIELNVGRGMDGEAKSIMFYASDELSCAEAMFNTHGDLSLSASNGTTTDVSIEAHGRDDEILLQAGTIKVNGTLDANIPANRITGTISAANLPSYVDDVIEGYLIGSQFYKDTDGAYLIDPSVGKVYTDLYTNKTYRWSGTTYVPIGSDLALGETSATAFRGDQGKVAYDHATAKGNAYNTGFYKVGTNAEGHVTSATAVSASDITELIGQPDWN
jgi:hypothetical protein